MPFQQFIDQYIVVPTNRYRKVKTFSRIKGPINSIIFVDHRIVVSGGDDEAISVWDIQQHKLLQTLHDRGTNLWGQVTSIACTNTADGGLGFVVGTGRGVIVAFKLIKSQQKAEFQEQDCLRAFAEDNVVEALAFDSTHKRLVVASHSGNLKLYQLESNGTWIEKWKLSSHVNRLVRGLHFVEQGQRVVTYTMESGSVHRYDTLTGKEIANTKRSLQSFVANMDYHPDTQGVLVDNLVTGFDLYTPTKTSPAQRFEAHRILNGSYAVGVKFGENGTLVVGGSDHGAVYIFQINSGERLQVLAHGSQSTIIQTIATHTSPDGEHIIVSGSSKLPTSSICVWRRPGQIAGPTQSVHSHVAATTIRRMATSFYNLAFAVLLVASLWNIFSPQPIQSDKALAKLSSLYHSVVQPPSANDHSQAPGVIASQTDVAWFEKLPLEDLYKVSQILEKAKQEKMEGNNVHHKGSQAAAVHQSNAQHTSSADEPPAPHQGPNVHPTFSPDKQHQTMEAPTLHPDGEAEQIAGLLASDMEKISELLKNAGYDQVDNE